MPTRRGVVIDEKAERHLAGIDINYRYVPLSQAAYRGLVWGTAVLLNREKTARWGFPMDLTGATAHGLRAPQCLGTLQTISRHG